MKLLKIIKKFLKNLKMALINKKLSGFDKLEPTEIDNTTKIVALSGQSPNNKNILLSDLIEDTLTSTNEYAALSAKQGKTLKSLIDNMEVAPSENVFNTNLYMYSILLGLIMVNYGPIIINF